MGIFDNFLNQGTGGLLGFTSPGQPPVQGAPTPVARPTERGQAPSATNRLFQNPAFLSALNSFGQALVQPGQVPGQAINTGQRLTQGLGQFNQQFAQQQQAQQLLKAKEAKDALAARLTEAQIGKLTGPERRVAVSAIGKIKADVAAGLMSKDEGMAAISKALAPDAPLVVFDKEKKRDVLSEERRGGLITGIFDSADTARNVAGNLATIEANLDSIVEGGGTSGPGFGVRTFINDAAKELLPNIEVNLSETASLTAIEGASNALAVPLTKKLGVNPTDKDFEIVKSTVARAGTSLPANYAMVDAAKQAANRSIKLENIAINAEKQGLNEIEIRERIRDFKDANLIKPAIALSPNDDPKKLKINQRYATSKGVFIFDGENMVRVR